MNLGQLFDSVFVIPTLNLLVLFYNLFAAIHLPGALGFAIIALTIVIKLILQPVFNRMTESNRKMQALKPQLDRLNAKYKDDRKKLQEEQMKLFKEHGYNPAAGCLPMLIQLPVMFGLYNALSKVLMNGTSGKAVAEINKLLYMPALKLNTIDPWFLGYNLALVPQKAGEWHYYLVPVVTGLLQYAQGVYGVPQPVTPAAGPVKKNDKKLTSANASPPEAKKDTGGDLQKAMGMQMKYILPVMVGYFSFILPVGLALYWNVFAIFSIIQYRRVNSKS